MNLLDHADTIISTREIYPILDLYKLSLSTKLGAEIRARIEAQLDYINPYEEKFDSFQELVLHHDHETSPLQKLLSSNGYLVIEDNMKLPWSFDEFIRLFLKTRFRGLRILPSLLSKEKTSIEENDSGHLHFALTREADSALQFNLVFYEKEYFEPGRDNDYGQIQVFSNAKDKINCNYKDYKEILATKRVKLHSGNYFAPSVETIPAKDVIERFFDATRTTIENYTLFFSKDLDYDVLLDEYYQREQDVLVFQPLQDNGEFTVHEEYDTTVKAISLDYRIVTNIGGFINISGQRLKEYFIPYHSASLDRWTDFPDAEEIGELSKEEQYSIYEYISNYFTAYEGVPGTIRFQSLRFASYGCYDTGAEILSLVSNEKIDSTVEFSVENVHVVGDYFFHDILLL